MDTFVEHIVSRRFTTKDTLLRVLIVTGAIIVAVLLVIVSGAFGLGTIGLVVAAGALYGGYFLFTGMSVEYEYIITNGEIDVDKIIAKRKRKRLLTVQVKTFEQFGRYDPNTAKTDNCSATVIATDNTGIGAYYAVFRHATLGQALLLFTPDERVLEAIKISLPRSIKLEK